MAHLPSGSGAGQAPGWVSRVPHSGGKRNSPGVLGLSNLDTMFFIQPDLACLMGGVAALSGGMLILRLPVLLVAHLCPR